MGSAIPHYENRLSLLEQLSTKGNAQVKKWVRKVMPYIKNRLSNERMQLEQRYV